MSTATPPSLRRHSKRAPSSDPIPIAKPSSNPSIFPSRILSKSLDSSRTHKLRAPQNPGKPGEEEAEGGGGEFVPAEGFEGLEIEAKKEKRLVCSVPGPGFNGGGRRRSFGGNRGELADVLASNGVKVVSADMPPLMQIHAVELARKVHDSLEKFASKTLASTLKKEFDGIYGPAWHCIVGTSFGSFVTHSVGGFLYFSMDQKMYILLFKTTVQRAD